MKTLLLSIVACLVLECSSLWSQQLIVAYDFNGEIGNSFAADKSGFGATLNASLASGASIINDPIRGNVLRTSPSGFGAETIYNSKLDFSTSFTLQARIKAPIGSPTFQHIAGRPGSGPRMFNHWGLGGLGAAQRTMPFQGFNPVDFGPGGSNDGQWHHMLITWNHMNGNLTGCYDGVCNSNNDPSTALATHPGLIFSMGGNPVAANNGLPNTLIDDVAFWNGWADQTAVDCLVNGTCNIYDAPITNPVVPGPLGPYPIQRNGANQFFINNSASFDSSGLTMDIRRYAQIPDSAGIARPRMSSLSYAPGVEGVFVVDEGLSGQNSPATGTIYHVTSGGSSVSTTLNIGSVLPIQHSGLLGQGGVRSLAFHPEFSQQGTPGYGKLYTTQLMSRTGGEQATDYLGPQNPALNIEGSFPNTNRYDGVLGEWTATFDSGGNFTGIDSGSFRQILRVATPSTQHPMKQIAFNPLANPVDEDYGLLYLLHGDGVNSESQGTGLNGSNALGKVLRIDPIQSGGNPYSVPPTNPFIGNPGVLDEIFTMGHRNVHTIAFGLDSQGNTIILSSEIGQETVDEINVLEAGASYGWGEREGTFLRNGNGTAPLPTTTDNFTYPVAQYGHITTGGNAVAGGYAINNGSELDGFYFFSDFSNGEKPMFAIALDDAAAAVTSGDPANLEPTQPLTVSLLFDHDDNPNTPSIVKSSFLDILDDELTYDGAGRSDLRFGRGPEGELYLLNKHNGWVYLVSNSMPFDTADFDRDYDVDSIDLEIWQTNYGTSSGAIMATGDADGDGDVDGTDFLSWQRQFTGSSGTLHATVQVPEPQGVVIACAFLASLLSISTRFKENIQ